MNLAGRIFGSSIGRKVIMAITGLILTGFVIGHLVGNLQIFAEPDHINGYGAFLHQLGPLLWVARIVLIVSAVLHIWAATVLTMENHAARDVKYGVTHTLRATLSSRLMRVSGVVVLAFLIYHLAHFTLGFTQAATFKESLPLYTLGTDFKVAGFITVRAGTPTFDVYNMVVLGFQKPVVSLFYIIAVGLLSLHLLHGADSMFQTMGWRSEKWAGGLRKIVVLFCLVYFVGNLAIPGAVLLGKLRPHEPARVAATR